MPDGRKSFGLAGPAHESRGLSHKNSRYLLANRATTRCLIRGILAKLTRSARIVRKYLAKSGMALREHLPREMGIAQMSEKDPVFVRLRRALDPA